jgi:GTP-binding protein
MSEYPLAHFLNSAWQPHQFPSDDGVEVAFAGRSNSGKSSAINAITGRNGLARVSKTPGRTQLINFFELDGPRRLVDLPGYGYAKVPQKMQQHWRSLLIGYFEKRHSLAGCVLIVDSRRGMQDFDRQMLEWSLTSQVPVHVLFTKSDKLTQSEYSKVKKAANDELGSVATLQFFSSTTKRGVPEARQALDNLYVAAEQDHEYETKKDPGGS